MIGAYQRGAPGEVDVVGDAHEVARVELRIQRARSIGDDKCGSTEGRHHPHAHAHVFRLVSLVEVAASLL